MKNIFAMKTTIILYSIMTLFLITIEVHSQQLISSYGSYHQTADVMLSSSLGEAVIETFDKTEAALTQGFHQAGFNSVQNLYIMKGWSGISTYLIPGNRNPEVMFHPVMIDLVILQNYQGVLWPVQNINTLGNWDFQNGYITKVSADVNLRIYGYDPAQNWVALDAGWSLMPVLSKTSVPVSVLDSLNENFVLAKEVAGWGVYWPEKNINTLPVLLSGKAYQVLLNDPDTLYFPKIMKKANGLQHISHSGNPLWEPETPAPGSHVICLDNHATKMMLPGDYIGVFSESGICCGQVEITSGEFHHVLVVFGSENLSVEAKGMLPDGKMQFVWLDAPGGRELLIDPVFDKSYPEHSGDFTKNGLSAITGFTEAAGAAEYNFGLHVNIFPNPTSGKINISGLSNGAEISVRDIHGRIVETGKAQLYRQSLDLSGLQPGVYFVEIEAQSKSIIKKLIVH
jgi:hypothetical protein